MIVDVFPFYNELEMLEYRLETLYPVVDKFVLVEATLTHRGNPKELFYEKNKNKFIKFSDKIIHVIDNELVADVRNPWHNEQHQRDYARGVLMTLGLKPDDIIINCDLDEIPDPEVVKTLDTLLVDPLMSLEMEFHYYNLESKFDWKWTQSNALRFCLLGPMTCLTVLRHHFPRKGIPNAGWHLSYFGNYEFILNKLKNFCHAEFADKANTVEDVERILKNSVSIIDGSKLTHVPLSENQRLPPNCELLLKKNIL